MAQIFLRNRHLFGVAMGYGMARAFDGRWGSVLFAVAFTTAYITILEIVSDRKWLL